MVREAAKMETLLKTVTFLPTSVPKWRATVVRHHKQVKFFTDYEMAISLTWMSAQIKYNKKIETIQFHGCSLGTALLKCGEKCLEIFSADSLRKWKERPNSELWVWQLNLLLQVCGEKYFHAPTYVVHGQIPPASPVSDVDMAAELLILILELLSRFFHSFIIHRTLLEI